MRLLASLELDGELAPLERRLLAAHLERCPECGCVVGAMRDLSLLVRAAALEPAPASRPPRRRRTLAAGLGGAGAVALAFALGLLVAVHGRPAGGAGEASRPLLVAELAQPWPQNHATLAFEARASGRPALHWPQRPRALDLG